MFVGVIWLIFCFVVAYGASNRNRSFFWWFLISLIVSPPLAAVFLIVLGESKD